LVVKALERNAAGEIAKENVRRYWTIGLIALVIYLMMGPLPLILAHTSGERTAAWGAATNFSTFAALGVVFSIVSAVAVFRYLHSPSIATVTRSLPIGKRALFLSSFASGLILTLAPFIVCALTVLPFAAGSAGSAGTAGPADQTAFAGWLTWVLAVCTTSFFTYAVSVLAGMASGNAPMHILTALVFNFAWIFIYSFTFEQARMFLYGLPLNSDIADAVSYFHPALYFLGSTDVNTVTGVQTAFQPAAIAVYLIAAAVISAFACLAFLRVKAERAGRSVTARPAEYIFVFVVAALGMLFGGNIFGSMDPYNPVIMDPDNPAASEYYYYTPNVDPMTYVNPYYIAGAFIGAAVAFIVATMILRRSARVFDLSALRRFGVFAAFAAALMLCTMTNITGFETRVPGSGDASHGALGIDALLAPPYKYNILGDNVYLSSKDNITIFSQPYIPIEGESDTETLAAFHRKALDDKAYIIHTNSDGDEPEVKHVEMGYRLRAGAGEMRSYRFSADYLQSSNEYARLISSESVKSYLSIENLLGYDDLNTPDIAYSYDGYTMMDATPDTDARAKLTGDALAELAKCLDEDYRAMSANDMMDPGKELFTLKLSSSRPTGKTYATMRDALYSDGNGKGNSNSLALAAKKNALSFNLYYTVTEKSVKTVAWLKDAGLYDSFVNSAGELERRYHDDTNGGNDV
jgi:hypothetical protein